MHAQPCITSSPGITSSPRPSPKQHSRALYRVPVNSSLVRVFTDVVRLVGVPQRLNPSGFNRVALFSWRLPLLSNRVPFIAVSTTATATLCYRGASQSCTLPHVIDTQPRCLVMSASYSLALTMFFLPLLFLYHPLPCTGAAVHACPQRQPAC